MLTIQIMFRAYIVYFITQILICKHLCILYSGPLRSTAEGRWMFLLTKSSIKVSKLRKLGYLCKMSQHGISKNLMESKPEGERIVGWPRLRWMDGWMEEWIDGLVEDLRKLGIKGWWMVAKNREDWTKFLGESEVQTWL